MTEDFTQLEQAALTAIVTESGDKSSALANLLLNARVVMRQNSGGGFYTTISPDYEAPPLIGEQHFGTCVFADISGINHGIGLILHLQMGRPHLLEGYSQGGEDTHDIDFAKVGFRIYTASQPAR